MDKDLIGVISGVFVIVSVIPYAIRTYQGKVQPKPISWILWAVTGLVLLLTYKSSGAGANVWPAVFGFTNPSVIFFLTIWKKRHRPIVESKINKEKIDIEPMFTTGDLCCGIISLVSLGGWFILRDRQELVQYALYLAILADCFAAVPTIIFVWKKPSEDRPFAWCMFALGYGLAIFAISDHSVANYALPLWMFFGSGVVSAPLVWFRWKQKHPLSEWV